MTVTALKVLRVKLISLSSVWSYCESYLFVSSQPIFFSSVILTVCFVSGPPLPLSFNHLYDELVCCRIHVDLFLLSELLLALLCLLIFVLSGVFFSRICLCWFLCFVVVRQIWHHKIIIYLRFYVYKTKHHFYYMLFQLIIIGQLFYFWER